MEDVDAAVRFLNFLKDHQPRFEARLAILEEDRWQVSTAARVFEWPKGRFEWAWLAAASAGPRSRSAARLGSLNWLLRKAD